MVSVNLVPLESVVARVLRVLPKDSVTQDELEEWAYEAYESIAPKEIYEIGVCYQSVYNNTSPIPKGAFRILMVLYKTMESGNNNCMNCGTNSASIEAINEEYKLDGEMYVSDSTNISTIPLNYIRPSQRNTWMPLAYSENYFHNSLLCKDSPNIYTHCEHSFSINARTKCLVTTFDEGHLAIAYTSIPKDEDGNWLIVDVETVKKAVETHCLKRYWQLRMNMREDGAIGMYKNYSSEYEFLAPKATAELMMPDFFEYQNIRNMNKFIKEDSPFSVALGALNGRELMKFNNPPRGSSFHLYNSRL
jgi:hypothetical protein